MILFLIHIVPKHCILVESRAYFEIKTHSFIPLEYITCTSWRDC